MPTFSAPSSTCSPAAKALRLTCPSPRSPPWACADDRGRHDYDLAATTVTLDITAGPRNGQGVSLRQVNPPRPQPPGPHPHLPDGSERRRGVLAHVVAVARRKLLPPRPHPLALDSYPQTPDDQKRIVPSSAKTTAATGVRGRSPGRRCGAGRRRRRCGLCSPRPRALRDPHQPGSQRPGGSRLARARQRRRRGGRYPGPRPVGDLAPDMVWLDAEIK
jgi:hypothetical protein